MESEGDAPTAPAQLLYFSNADSRIVAHNLYAGSAP